MNTPLIDLKITVESMGQSANVRRPQEMADSDFSRYVRDPAEAPEDAPEDQTEPASDEIVGMCITPILLSPAVSTVAGTPDVFTGGVETQAPAEPVTAPVAQGVTVTVPPLNTDSAPVVAEDLTVPQPEVATQGGMTVDGIDVTLASVSGKADSVTDAPARDKVDVADNAKAGDGLDIVESAGDATDNPDMSSDDGGADDSGAGADGTNDAQGRTEANPSQGEARRVFSTDVQALYGATSALNARNIVTPMLGMADPAQLASQQIAHAAQSSQDGTIELALSPDELGHVKMVLHSDDGKLHVTIQAERPETQDLLRRHLEGLEKDFRSAGYSDVAFSFDGQGQGQQSRQPVNVLSIDEETETDRFSTPVPTATRVTTGGLDLRI
ncbi:MAG TPA: flagellar hook-length control protein FliK [Paenirhodobacter sp.]